MAVWCLLMHVKDTKPKKNTQKMSILLLLTRLTLKLVCKRDGFICDRGISPTLPLGGTTLSLWLGALLSPQSLQVNRFIYCPLHKHSGEPSVIPGFCLFVCFCNIQPFFRLWWRHDELFM